MNVQTSEWRDTARHTRGGGGDHDLDEGDGYEYGYEV
jgi:hypothetical protein